MTTRSSRFPCRARAASIALGVGGAVGVSWAAVPPRTPVGVDPAESETREAAPDGELAPMTGAGCDDAPEVGWFGAIRRLPDCFDRDAAASGAVDVNGDGRLEHWEDDPRVVISNGTVVPELCVGALYRAAFDGQAVVMTAACLVKSQAAASWFIGQFGPTLSLSVEPWGWHDVDLDGDLDLILNFSPGSGAARRAWLENVGYEATQPLTGDLDLDGQVDSADLAILLGGWTS